MPAPKWLVVARNEYRIRTSWMRKTRPYFPFLVIGLLAIYVAFIAPTFVDLFIGDFFSLFPPQAAMAMVVAIVQIILFTIFFYFIIIPITYTLMEVQTEQLEIFLAAPVKPSDVLLGEFLGQMPFYAIAVTIIAGFFTALLNPLGLDMLQITITIAIFVVTFFSAYWIGNVIAAVLRTRFGRTARGKDIGKALALLIALPMVAIMYAIMGGGLIEALANPGTSGMVKTVLGVLPSSWGAEVIVSFATSPGSISAVAFETLTRFGGLIAFFLAVLWLGTKAADHAYSLETTTFIASRTKPDGAFYKIVKNLGGGGSFGTLLVSVFKDYGRRLENLSKIAYMLGVLVLINVFLARPDDPEVVLLMPQLILPLLSAFVLGEVTLRGKECLFIYRKTPSGVGRFVKARLLQGWLTVVPISVVATAVLSIVIPGATLVSLLTNTGIVMLAVAASVPFALGLFLLHPAFSEKGGDYVLNLMVVMQGWVGLSIFSLIVFGRTFRLGLYETLVYVTVPLSWLVGIVFLYFGKRKLSRME